MKELTIEQKAKAYDEALERMKSWVKGEHPECFTEAQKAAKFIFPELKESEDERMWKLIKKYVHYNISDIALNADHITREQLESWLEKQGEEPQGKSALEAINEEKVDNQNCVKPDKVEPKFHEGDFIVDPYCRGKIIALTSDAYLLDTGQGVPFSCEDNVRLWTIQDAKDGDVLVASDGSIFLFAGVVDCACKYYAVLTTFNEVKIKKEYDSGYWETSRAVHPATKNQRDLLFKKMRKAGYEWDAEKKKLKKIDDEEVNGEDYGIDGFWHAKRILEKTLGSVSGYQTDDGILDHKAAITAVKKLYEQKPTWTEEDEKRLNSCLIILQPKTLVGNTETMNTKWLKSLKERIRG